MAHICRDRGYSPYKNPCRECVSQMSRNGHGLNKRRQARVQGGK